MITYIADAPIMQQSCCMISGHSAAHNLPLQAQLDQMIGGLRRSLSSGRASRGPVGLIHEVSLTADYACPAALRIKFAIVSGCEIRARWLAFTSMVVAPMRLAMNRSRSGLMVRSSVETA